MDVRTKTIASATGSVMTVNVLRPALVYRVEIAKFVQPTASAKAHYQLVTTPPIVTEIKFVGRVCAKSRAIVHVPLIVLGTESA